MIRAKPSGGIKRRIELEKLKEKIIKNMNKSKLFQYAVIWHPTEAQAKEGKKSKMVVELKTTLATDEKSAGMAATFEIPTEYRDQLDQVEVVVVNFR